MTPPYLMDARVGYELRPFSLVREVGPDGTRVAERTNSEGFRGPERTQPKPKGVFRILAIGDSVVQGSFLHYRETWEQILDEELDHRADRWPFRTRFEVINAGRPGYMASQALARLEIRGLKYQPDLVMVLVCWNDMLCSSLPIWRQGLSAADIGRAYVNQPPPPLRTGVWADLKNLLYRHLYTARLIRQARNGIWNQWRIKRELQERQVDSGLPFNDRALRLYLDSLEKIYQVTRASGPAWR